MINNILKTKGKLLVTVIVVLFLFIFITQNIFFVLKDTAPKATDNQIRNAAVYYRHYCLNQKSKNWIPRNFPYPPILYINSFPFFSILGISMESARLSLIIFSVIFLLAMFGIGKELGDSFSGLAVMALAASSPHFLNLSRSFYTDLPQIAFTALSLYFLIKSNSFSDRLSSVFLGVALALSFLSKWSTAFFILFPIMWFFIPIIIKKVNNNINRLISLGAAITITSSIFLYYILIDINSTGNKWIPAYFLAILIPVVLWGLLIYLQEKNQKNDKEYHQSGNYQLMNFSIMILIFFTLASPWYLWSGHSIKQKFLSDLEWHRNIALNFEILLVFVRTAFNLASILIIVGLVYIFIKREKLYRNLVFPLSFLAAFFLMITIGNPQFRYIFTLLIFLSVIGGYWVSNTGKAKVPITVIVLMLSMISILCWTVITPDDHIFRAVKTNCERQAPRFTVKLFCSEKPDNSRYNCDLILDWIFKGSKMMMKPMIVVTYFVNEENPLEMESLYWVAYQRNLEVGPIFSWNLKERNDGSLYIKIFRDSYSSVFRSQKIEEIIIIHRTSISKEKMVRALKFVTDALGAIPDEPVEEIEVGSNVSFTCLRYKRGLKNIIMPKTKTPTIVPELSD